MRGISDVAIREISMLKSLDHKNIIKLYEVIKNDLKISYVMEYCETNLFRYLHTKRIQQ
jgi:cyclin-dependent kinase